MFPVNAVVGTDKAVDECHVAPAHVQPPRRIETNRHDAFGSSRGCAGGDGRQVPIGLRNQSAHESLLAHELV